MSKPSDSFIRVSVYMVAMSAPSLYVGMAMMWTLRLERQSRDEQVV